MGNILKTVKKTEKRWGYY